MKQREREEVCKLRGDRTSCFCFSSFLYRIFYWRLFLACCLLLPAGCLGVRARCLCVAHPSVCFFYFLPFHKIINYFSYCPII